MSRCVIFTENLTEALLLSGVTFDGVYPISGFVENGVWYWRMVDGMEYALHHEDDPLDKAENKWSQRYLRTFIVPSDWWGDYNDIIRRAIEEMQKPTSAPAGPCCEAPEVDHDLCRHCGAVM